MKRYLSIYRKFFRFGVLRLVVYRASLFSNILSSLLWGTLLFISIFLLTSHSKTVYGLSVTELMLVTAGYNTMIGIFHCLFSHNFERLSRIIRYGELDSILLKPVDSHFYVTTQYVNMVSLVRVPLGFLTILYIAWASHLPVTIADFGMFAMLLLFGLLLLYSVWSIVTTLLIYFPRMQNIIDLMFSVSGFSRYPRGMYQQFGSVVFLFFFPFTLVVLVPIGILLHTVNWQLIASLCFISVGLFLFAHYFWNFALRSYASASS